ncbi:hypothetical protein F5884DRAFT_448243 [Xylogone sp. PMI_703]|nr:hypothetical protein F5884DRAFT_448243 [Xylogone sp. PMI_703]
MPIFINQQYDRLPDLKSEAGIDDEMPRAVNSRSCRLDSSLSLYAVIIGLLSIYAFGATIFIILTGFDRNIPSKGVERRFTCGNSPAEATDNGCIFDQLLMGWTPIQCPQGGTEEFIDYQRKMGWKYWQDLNMTKEIPRESLGTAVGTIYSTELEHSAHCAFLLRRAFWVAERTGQMRLSWEHLHHCAMYMLNITARSSTWADINTASKIHYDSCWVTQAEL